MNEKAFVVKYIPAKDPDYTYTCVVFAVDADHAEAMVQAQAEGGVVKVKSIQGPCKVFK